MNKRGLFSGLLLFLFLSLVTTSCGLIPIPPILATGTGTMLVQNGKYLYKIGGFASDDISRGGITSGGKVQNTVYMATTTLNLDGRIPDESIHISSWSEALPLPEGRAFGAAFSIGQYLYVIGGEDESGPVDTIYIAKVDITDGSLGFFHTYYSDYSDYSDGEKLEGPSYWVTHTTKLPQPRSHMGWNISDGRIFLVGGTGSAGELDTIIHARIQVERSGKTGIWYESPVTLPQPRTDISVGLLNDRLYILGGKTANSLKDLVFSYALNPYGLLSDYRTEPKLPAPRGRLQVISDGERLVAGSARLLAGSARLLAGSGYNFEGEQSDHYWALDLSHDLSLPATGWSTLAEKSTSAALSHARIAGNILLIGDEISISILNLNLAPMAPEIIPGSGYIRKKGTTTSLWTEPGNTVRYRIDPPEIGAPTSSDTAWDPANPYPVETDYATTVTFQAFSESDSSPAVTMNYYPLLLPSFFSDTILINNTETASYTILSFTDTLLNGTVNQLEEALYRIPVYRTYTVVIDWQDSTSDRSTYTSQADFTLLEEDYFTEVLDTNGVPVASKPILYSARSGSGYGNPVTVILHPGIYYLHITDTGTETGSTAGGTVGFSIMTSGGSR